MTVQSMKSNEAHQSWGTLLENALKGIPTIIQRYSRPAAVLINYDEWRRLKGAEIQKLNQQSAEIELGNYVTGEEVDRVLGT